LKAELCTAVGKISFEIDGATDSKAEGWCGLVLHIPTRTHIITRVGGLYPLPPRHNAQAYQKATKIILKECGILLGTDLSSDEAYEEEVAASSADPNQLISPQIFKGVTDRARVMINATKSLGVEHSPCMAHTFDSILTDVLELEDYKALLDKARRMVTATKVSCLASGALTEAQINNGMVRSPPVLLHALTGLLRLLSSP